MDNIEQQLYEAFGLGEQAQEPANPAQNPSPEDIAEGEKAQEIAVPAQEEDTQEEQAEPAAGAEPREGEEAEVPNGKAPLTPEQRRENAAARRRAETQAAIDAAVADAQAKWQKDQDARMEKFFSQAGLKNTISGEPIKTMAEFDSWRGQFDQARLEQDLKKGKLTPEALATAIGSHPLIRQAQAILDRESQARQQAEIAQAQAKIDQEVARIRERDKSVESLADVLNGPKGQEILDMTEKGYSLWDAWYLANRETLENARAEAAANKARSDTRGKDHMQGAGQARGQGSLSVPKEDMEMFRAMNPGATDVEIQKFYNKYMRNK